jgi:copper(I)-binding protein
MTTPKSAHGRVIALIACALLSACHQQSKIEPGGVHVSDARSNALPPTATVGAAYMKIESGAADELVSADTPIAEKVEFHTTQNENGTMQMRELADLQISPDRPLVFSPGANHMMLLGLRQPLAAGNTFTMTLHFRRAGAVNTTIEVRNDLGE